MARRGCPRTPACVTLWPVRRNRGVGLAEVPRATAEAWEAFVNDHGAGSKSALARAIGAQLATFEVGSLPKWLNEIVLEARRIHAHRFDD